MFISHIPNRFFYSAGKIATQTLCSIPLSVQITPTEDTRNLRATAIREIKRLMVKSADPVTIVIRDPVKRFNSGLYEIIVKQVYGMFVLSQATHGSSVSTVEETINLFYSKEFWEFSLDKTLRLRPNTWNPLRELDSQRWQYHVGNWLDDVKEVTSTAKELGRNCDIVDVNNLNDYLNSLSIEFKHVNKGGNLLWRLGSIAGFEGVYSRIDHKCIQSAFNAALDSVDAAIADQFNNYLKPEIELYKQLQETACS